MIASSGDERANIGATERELPDIINGRDIVNDEGACKLTCQDNGAPEADWDQLKRLERRCEGFGRDDQSTVQGSWTSGGDVKEVTYETVQQNLYCDLWVNYSALKATSSRIERTHEARSDIKTAIFTSRTMTLDPLAGGNDRTDRMLGPPSGR
jgi:hypothetical protein